MKATIMTTSKISTLDLSDYINGSPSKKMQFVVDVGESLKDTGFFILKGHGIDPTLMKNVYRVANNFFDQPEAYKKSFEIDELQKQRGFISFGAEHAKNNKYPDLKEFWHVGPEWPEGHPLKNQQPPNVWPNEEFKAVMSKAYLSLNQCAMMLLDAVSVYLGEKERFLRDLSHDGISILRVINYPPIPEGAHPSSIRSAPHEDINLITLLAEATAPGLELLTKEGTWLPIEAAPGELIVDAGDMLQNISNGIIKSTTHRVTNPDNSRSRRFSMPFFAHPRPEVDLSPREKCVKLSGGKELFPKITAEQYLSQRLKEIGLKK